jgi:hypothetical protein
MKILRLAVIAAALSCSACGTMYTGPVAGTPTAELVVRPAAGGNAEVKEYVYRVSGLRAGALDGQLMAAFFMARQDDQVVKLPAGQEFFMRYSMSTQLHFPPMSCLKNLAFTPIEGHRYQLDRAVSWKECKVFVWDMTTDKKVETREY